MTLKEKFEQSDILISRQKRVLSQVKIADEFAIGFMEWVCKNYRVEGIVLGILDSNDLLKDYKKEKGL